jgi:UPF0716 protein FxsA
MTAVKWALMAVILLPAAELAVFIALAVTIGWFWTAVLSVGTSVIGVLMLKQSGRRDLDQFRAALGANGLRAFHLESPGLAKIVGGILLVFPGFITDALGALLFVPQFRRWAASAIGRAVQNRRAARDPSVVDLTHNEWRQIPDAIEDSGEKRKRLPRGRRDAANRTKS